MQEAVPVGVGALAAIVGLEESEVQALCDESVLNDEVLSPANFNSKGQVVIAGHKTAVDRAIVLAKAKGAKLAILLPVSVPSHCRLMKPAAERLEALLSTMEIKTPTLSVVNNVAVTVYQKPDDIRAGLVKQLFSPVRWADTLQVFATKGVTHLIECGPGNVLTGLSKRMLPGVALLNTSGLSQLNEVLSLS